MFTFAISCLTTSSLPGFMDLTFQVPMQYCSLQHQTLLPSPITSTAECCFCFGSTFSFFLELFLHSSPVAYWAPTDLGSSSFSVLSFCRFILFRSGKDGNIQGGFILETLKWKVILIHPLKLLRIASVTAQWNDFPLVFWSIPPDCFCSQDEINKIMVILLHNWILCQAELVFLFYSFILARDLCWVETL